MGAKLDPSLRELCEEILRRDAMSRQGRMRSFYLIVPYSEVGNDGIRRDYISYQSVRAPSFERAVALAGHEVWDSGLSAKLRGDIVSCAVHRENIRLATAEERQKHYRM